MEFTRSNSATPAKQQRRRTDVRPLPYVGGEQPKPKYGVLEAELERRKLASSEDAAKSMIRDWPKDYAAFLQTIVDVAPERLTVINCEVDLVLENIQLRPLDHELIVAELQRDGRQNLSLGIYLTTPTNHPERAARAQAAIIDCLREIRVLQEVVMSIKHQERYS